MENRYTNTEEFKRLKAEKEAQRNEEQEDYIDHFKFFGIGVSVIHCFTFYVSLILYLGDTFLLLSRIKLYIRLLSHALPPLTLSSPGRKSMNVCNPPSLTILSSMLHCRNRTIPVSPSHKNISLSSRCRYRSNSS